MAPKYGGRNPKVEVDRISSLPDEVLSLILSLLPRKCAVGTSILSNRWKYLWTSITSLHFEASPEHTKSVDFTNFVDKVFRDCNSSHIQKFHLHFNDYRADPLMKTLINDVIKRNVSELDITTWINEAIKPNVSELDIDVYKFPMSIFSCKTLTVLKLAASNGDGVYIPSFYLPCLKVLHIKWKNLPKDYMEKLFGSCPVLEDLILGGSLGYDRGDIFMVSAPALKTLRIQVIGHYWSPPTLKMFINAPNLEYLHLEEGFHTYSIKGDFPSLIKANVNTVAHCTVYRHPCFQLLKGLSAVKSLSLSSTQRICNNFTVPKFCNLTCLEVSTCDHLFWAILPKLIDSSPSLEVLSLEQRANVYAVLPEENTWVEPKSVPECLRYHLAAIKIEGFKGRKHDLELLKYCLGNAKVLQRLTINCRGLTQVEEMQFCVQLLEFSRDSRNCQIHFHGDLSQTNRQPPFWKFL